MERRNIALIELPGCIRITRDASVAIKTYAIDVRSFRVGSRIVMNSNPTIPARSLLFRTAFSILRNIFSPARAPRIARLCDIHYNMSFPSDPQRTKPPLLTNPSITTQDAAAAEIVVA